MVASSGAYAWDQAGKLPDNDLIDTQGAANAAEQTALPRVTPFPPADPVLAPAATSSSSLCALAAANGRGQHKCGDPQSGQAHQHDFHRRDLSHAEPVKPLSIIVSRQQGTRLYQGPPRPMVVAQRRS
ncbi:hypothetical protein BFX40_28825 [Mesorhizobium sp. SEMIA 3007]|uniref:hypothetical protein n=1 Tax=Mesorhizobium sp. SEMIA 3007 TaxID=1862350 RepID=UPI00083CB0D2|nr:hypothetical protein [Mesorhizobium sp. SEMIA 3007]ODA96465.1 hypothetical protein BFX40_28825 [Mesorhizobium sp. SEMIA 3007]